MCGFVAVSGTSNKEAVSRALQLLAHRGPDGQGLQEVEEGVFLGHRRLSVIDLSGGGQPFHSGCGRYSIVYNGEIYNYRELRADLQAFGKAFRTASDTEVLVEGFAHYGLKFLPMIDGIFAFTIWDRHQRQFVSARDRMGVKPLFYMNISNLFAAASTVDPLLDISPNPLSIDFEALRDYFAFQTILAPRSIFREVRQLPPASYLIVPLDRPQVEGSYWSIPTAIRSEVSVTPSLVDEADAVIGRTVARQMVSDVPLGVFLSGGIDSSLVLSYAADHSTNPINCLSVRFPNAAEDEVPIAAKVAAQFGARHHVVSFAELSGEDWKQAVSLLDQPLADPAFFPLLFLSRSARSELTVALTGDGGDELFGGYSRYLTEDERLFPASVSKKWLRSGIDWGLLPPSLTRQSLSGRDRVRYAKVEAGPYPGSRKDVEALVKPEYRQHLKAQKTLERWDDLIDILGDSVTPDTAMRSDLWTYLSENCLVKTDRASMGASIEARVPFLGNDIVDFATSLPASVHIGSTHKKAILRELARRRLPEETWNRKKQGFTVPLQSIFLGNLAQVGDYLFDQAFNIAPFLDSQRASSIWRNAKAGRASRRLAYTLLALLCWLEQRKGRISFG